MPDVGAAPPETAAGARAHRRWFAHARRSLVHWLMAALVVGLVLLVVFAADILLLSFAGLLFAIVLSEASEFLRRYLKVSHLWGVVIVTLSLSSLAIMGLAFLVPTVIEQSLQLQEALPQAIEQWRAWSEQQAWIAVLWERLPPVPSHLPIDQLVTRLGGAISQTFGVVGSVVLVLFLGLLLAIQPHLYLDGLLKLVPIGKRPRAAQVLDRVGSALKWWLVARAISMATIGTLIWLGLLVLGVPFALTIAVIAVALTFIPYFGAVLTLVPALAAGLATSPMTAVWVLVLYLGIQALETYFITPLAEYKAANLPPALSITTQLTLALLVGPLGFILADPLLAAGMALVRTLYIEDILGDRESEPRDTR